MYYPSFTPTSSGSGYEMYQRLKTTKPKTRLNVAKVLNAMGSPGEILDMLILSLANRYKIGLERKDKKYIIDSMSRHGGFVLDFDTDLHELNI